VRHIALRMFLNEDAFNLSDDEGAGGEDTRGSLPPAPGLNDGRREYQGGGGSAQGQQRPGTASYPVRPISARSFGAAAAPAAQAPRGMSTFSNDLFGNEEDDPDVRGDGGGGGPGPSQTQLAAAQKMQMQRQLAAQKRRERQMLSGMIVQNDAVKMPPPNMANMRARPNPVQQPQLMGGAAAAGPLFGGSSPKPKVEGDDGGRPYTGALFGNSQKDQEQAMRSSASSMYANKADNEVSEGALTLQRDLAAAGLSSEYDPHEGKHPREVAANKQREKEVAEADAIGGAAKRTVGRPKAVKVDISDKRVFLMNPGPKAGPVQCHIVRKAGKGFIPGTSYPEYFLYIDGAGAKPGNPTSDAKFLLSARKRKKSKSSNYIISLDEDDLARQSGNFFGKLRSNFVGTEFTIFDKGVKPGESASDGGLSQLAPRTELGAVTYEYNVLGTRGPRKMTTVIPSVDGNGQRSVFRPVTADGKEGIIDQFRKGHTQDMLLLRNKPPKWNEQMQAYCLNFNGRVTHASVKNFQLVHEEDLDVVMLQFGKVGKDMFTMDFQYPMSALQAFAICLTSFDNKLACE